MTKRSYLIENRYLFWFMSILGLLLCLFLVGAGVNVQLVFLLGIVVVFSSVIFHFLMYWQQKKYFESLFQQLAILDKKYLIAEIAEQPTSPIHQLYFEVLRQANKQMMEEISSQKRGQEAYQEFIEQWIHEIKTPITAIKLMCENHPNTSSTKILRELEKLTHLTKQTLYYAKSDYVEKDFLLMETSLEVIIHQAITENRNLLRENKFQINIENCSYSVYTDRSWVVFILNQLITNSVHYRRKEKPECLFKATVNAQELSLHIIDNGQGIAQGELRRIFEKGFTGENGRGQGHATGMGLYLCKKLCQKLMIPLSVQSEKNKGTEVILTFPLGEKNLS